MQEKATTLSQCVCVVGGHIHTPKPTCLKTTYEGKYQTVAMLLLGFSGCGEEWIMGDVLLIVEYISIQFGCLIIRTSFSIMRKNKDYLKILSVALDCHCF